MSDTDKTRKYLVIGDTESGTVEVNKKLERSKPAATLVACLSLVVNMLDKFETNLKSELLTKSFDYLSLERHCFKI